MKKIIISLIFITVAFCAFPQEANMRFQSQIARLFALYIPSADYSVDWNANNTGEVLNIKFPEVKSSTYNRNIIPNLTIQIEKKYKSFDTKSELISLLNDMEKSHFKAISTGQKVDGVNLQYSIETFVACQSYKDLKINNMNHTILIMLGQYEDMAARVIFDATDDIFENTLETAKTIINSIILD